MKNNKNDNELIYLLREVGEEFREDILNKYRPLVNLVAHQKYKQQDAMGIDLEDYIQEGLIGLNNAIDHYNIDSTATFFTYASVCINRRINVCLRKFYRAKEVVDYKCYEEGSSYMIAEDSEHYAMNNYHYEKLISLKHMFKFERACVFELKYNGFTYKEISKLLGLTTKQIDRYLYEFRKFLKIREYNHLILE